MFFDVARGLNAHDVEQDVAQDHVVLGHVHVLLVEEAELVLVHVPHVRVLGGRICIGERVLLIAA